MLGGWKLPLGFVELGGNYWNFYNPQLKYPVPERLIPFTFVACLCLLQKARLLGLSTLVISILGGGLDEPSASPRARIVGAVTGVPRS